MEAKDIGVPISTVRVISDKSYEAGRRAGIKEVVEWLSTCMLREYCDTKDKDVFCRDYRVYNGEWQAKLKEWGILAP